MLYLKRSLKGEALKVIDALPVCNANYDVAWAALNKRYANEYILKKRHVNAMLLWPQMKTANNENIHGLIECFERNLKILQHLGESTDQWGILLAQIIISKLDLSTQQKWERRVEESNENSVGDLLNFLRAQTRIMDAVAVDKPKATGKVVSERRVASNVAVEAKCIKCGGSHLIDNCDAFRSEFYADYLKPDSRGILRADFGTALPTFIHTVFGWVAVGQVHTKNPQTKSECQQLHVNEHHRSQHWLHQLADDDGSKFPLAKQALKEDFYVDDYIGGASSVEEAARLQVELTMLLRSGGFYLTKWNCNRAEVLNNVPAEEKATSKVKRFEVPEEPVKTLGIAWLTESDQLYIDSTIGMSNENWTRRTIYSLVARIYDPLGLVAPVTAWAKINMQILWLATGGWDEEIPAELQERWCVFRSQLALLKDVKFSRHAVVANPVGLQLHCFSDASEAAYGACVYIRSIENDGSVRVELLAAKSRPAPLKRITLARLELCGALMAARLQKVVRQAIRHQAVETFMWTDATIVLHWIRAPSYSWATYVANRVSEIQDLTHGYKWMHVKGIDNPADIVSRGALPKELLSSTLWFHGPSWLQHPEDE
ncbi:uncharacterized protein LOC125774951 [Anopheles funestus]|uniref:uncharacterized protein LOC125774951 n=1 Tax=Anopheles funestus TaxID=62324 RepID=UPI0020C5CFBB|nr:uncharacterized protein LOC125774951 [Anopheles funestus]